MVQCKQLFNNFVRFIPLRFIYKIKPINSSKTERFYYLNPVKTTCFGSNQAPAGSLQLHIKRNAQNCTRNIVEAFVSNLPTRETIWESSKYATPIVSVPTVWLHGYQH
jgi:hypothetical protein